MRLLITLLATLCSSFTSAVPFDENAVHDFYNIRFAQYVPKFPSCNMANGYRDYMNSVGVIKTPEWFSCEPDNEDTIKEKLKKFSFANCDDASAKRTDDLNRKYYDGNYSCPPAYSLSSREKFNVIYMAIGEITGFADTHDFVVETSTSAIYYLKNNTKPRGKGIKSAWFYYANINRTFNTMSYKEQYMFNCVEGTEATSMSIGSTNLDGSGDTTTSLTPQASTLQFIDIVPGSIGEVEFDLVCNTKKTKLK